MSTSKPIIERIRSLDDAIGLAKQALSILIDIEQDRIDESHETKVARFIGESQELLEASRKHHG